MSKVTVKLTQKGTIFHDTSQPDGTITGDQPKELHLTSKVARAIKGGILEKVAAVAVKPKAGSSTDDSKDGGGDGGKGTEDKPDYSKMKKAELKAELTKREIKFEDTDTNAQLVALLVKSDSTEA